VSDRELVVLGTAGQAPTRSRNRNGYLLLRDGEGLLFDPGEGTQRQMLFAGVTASRITRICITQLSQRYEHDDGQRLAAQSATASGGPVMLAQDLDRIPVPSRHLPIT
jgi:ribonuclease BN (tRNA processing enzyme)